MSERWPMFDVKRDKAIIEAGGFWCSGCLSSNPAGQQSPDDPRYCQGCYGIIKGERELDKTQASRVGGWDTVKLTFITGVQRYNVTKTGGTVCLGPVGAPGDAVLTPSTDDSIGEIAVSKLVQVVNVVSSTPAIQNGGVMKHPGGRPRKEKGGEMSRVTAWRRRKEEQQAVMQLT